MKIILDQLAIVLIYGGIVQGFYLALLLNGRAARKSRANLFLSILLIAMSFSIAHIFFAGRIITHISANVYSLGDPTFLLIAPLLWFYVTELTGQRIKLSLKPLLHFIPFALTILFSLTFKSIHSKAFATFITENNRGISISFWVLVVIQFSSYQFFLHKKLKRHHELVQQEVSNTEDFNVSWVRFFMIVFHIINFFFLFSLFAVIHLDHRDWLTRTTALIFSLSVFALGYKGIFQKQIFNTKEDTIDSVGVPATNTITPPDQKLIDRLITHMEDRRPFIDPDLTLSSLAKDLGVSRSQLSHIINKGVGENFYDFVNKYRVEEVMRLMRNPKKHNYSMLGLALEAGFKSKSTFNLIFKRFTGLTPSEYRKNISS